MGRMKNDGRGRLGGRKAGTPNKPKTPASVWALGLIDQYRTQIEKDLPELDPATRAGVVASLAQLATMPPTE